MKYLGLQQGRFTFRLPEAERDLFVHILQQYPAAPPSAFPVLRRENSPQDHDEECWMQELLAEEKQRQGRAVRAWIDKEPALRSTGKASNLQLLPESAAWLVEILNEVRVGKWHQLDCPSSQQMTKLSTDAEFAPDIWIMEAASMFQMSFLSALHALEDPGAENESADGTDDESGAA